MPRVKAARPERVCGDSPPSALDGAIVLSDDEDGDVQPALRPDAELLFAAPALDARDSWRSAWRRRSWLRRLKRSSNSRDMRPPFEG